MLIPNHPEDERLAALASREPDAASDAELTAHVASCTRCSEVVDELNLLRNALAELPDLQPSRPLRLLPPVEAAPAPDRLGGWARRFFAPVLASGAALALVGVIGTAVPSFVSGPTSVFQSVGTELSEVAVPQAQASEAAAGAAVEAAASDEVRTLSSEADQTDEYPAAGGDTPSVTEAAEDTARDVQEDGVDGGVGERSPWPMVLFAGITLMVAALLMRWILAPRTD